MIGALPILLIAVVQVPATVVIEGGARSPALSHDGRLAVEIRGDLWVLGPGASTAPLRITATSSWERDPAWSSDSRFLIYSAQEGDSADLWRVRVGPTGPEGPPERLTSSLEPDFEPTTAADGRIVFVRGESDRGDLWMRDPDGTERRLTEEWGADRWPAFSPDGARIAFSSRRDGTWRVHVSDLSDEASRVITPDHAAERPTWSPSGARVAFTTRSGEEGVWVTDGEGSTFELVSRVPGEASFNGRSTLVVAEIPSAEPGYNGDPERLGDRERELLFPDRSPLRRVTLDGDVFPEDSIHLSVELPRAEYAEWIAARVGERMHQLVGRTGEDAWPGWSPAQRQAFASAESEAQMELAVHAALREFPPSRRQAEGQAVVSSAHPDATEAGLEILRRGGNVVDAAVAVSFALGVVEPDASGMGGYGQMMLFLEGMERPVAIDFLTRVPEAATLANRDLLDADGDLPTDGPVLVNVPGTVAGMELAYRTYGSGGIPWEDLLGPAISLAESGFVLDEAFTTTLSRERRRYAKYPSSLEAFFEDGAPPKPGDTLRNSDLAWTLRQVAGGGADAFYRGAVAERMVDDLRSHGNAMTLQDMSRYFAIERTPIETEYRGHTVFGSAPPTSGGALLAAKLNLLAQVPAGGDYTADADLLHAMIEAWKLAPSTRGRVADPGLWPVDVTPFESADTAVARWRCFDPQAASPPEATAGGCEGDDGRSAVVHQPPDEAKAVCALEPALLEGRCHAAGTTAFVVADGRGNMVSVTQTLGTWGGNFYLTPGLGFPYNDKLRSYSTNPDEYNARVPFARNVTSISPTLVFRGVGVDRVPYLALGAAGNAWITSAVYQTLIGLVDQGLGPARALALPRFLVVGARGGEGSPVIQYERGFDPEAVRELARRGHALRPISLLGELRMGYGAAAWVGGGRAAAGADPRRSGAAGSVR